MRSPAPRCNYCSRHAIVWYRYRARVPARGRAGSTSVTCTVAACAEHEGCPNWTGMRTLHPDARLERP